jgi:hypothetical protein
MIVAPMMVSPERDCSPLQGSEDVEKSVSHISNKEGTSYQSQLGAKAKRAHFFSPLDPAYADAVHRDAETVEYTAEEEKAVRRKIDQVVLPLVICSFVFNQFDRTNIGNAHIIPAFNDNFGITNNHKWTLVLSIFYVGYCLLEIPANILQRHIGANRFFFLSLTFWGLASLSTVYAKGYAGLLVLRYARAPYHSHLDVDFDIQNSVLTGIGEAGFYAGMIYYLSFWYKRAELALRISFCMTGTLPGAIGGLLAFVLVRAHTPVLTGQVVICYIVQKHSLNSLQMAISISHGGYSNDDHGVRDSLLLTVIPVFSDLSYTSRTSYRSGSPQSRSQTTVSWGYERLERDQNCYFRYQRLVIHADIRQL